MQTMVWSERTRMNQIDERVGLQAILTRMLSFSSGAVFFLREREEKKINSASLLLWGLRLVIWIWCMCDGWFWVEWEVADGTVVVVL
jgi:hypothetical protein